MLRAGQGIMPRSESTAAQIVHWAGRTPVQTFVLIPLCVIAFEFAWHRGMISVMPWGAPLLVWGYLQYRWVGRYRLPRAGGTPGMEVPPERILAQGPYRFTRNPMYLGHLIFLLGLALTFRSWLAWVILAARALWFHMRVLGDEARLEKIFGAEYDAYRARVKRWLPGVL
jgi:protein-S-isoprenylcysteine O-methyltransferase Ste14